MKNFLLFILLVYVVQVKGQCAGMYANASASPYTGSVPLTVNFINTSAGANTYEWIFGDGTNSILANPAHTYTAAGTYTVTLAAQNGPCIDTARLTVVVNAVGGTEKISNSNLQIDVNPNPSSGKFTIETNVSEKQMVFIFDADGKLVFNQFITGNATIDARSLNAGVYSLNVVSNQGSVTKKLVVVK
jgi:PKD repeat protein